MAKPTGDDLEPYRRLIEIQKQIIETARRHEQTRRECDVLREQVVREVMESLHQKMGLRRRLHLSVARLLRRLSRLPRRVDSFARSVANRIRHVEGH